MSQSNRNAPELAKDFVARYVGFSSHSFGLRDYLVQKLSSMSESRQVRKV